jgi:hypothetical protein
MLVAINHYVLIENDPIIHSEYLLVVCHTGNPAVQSRDQNSEVPLFYQGVTR